jgi:hypothetical protein
MVCWHSDCIRPADSSSDMQWDRTFEDDLSVRRPIEEQLQKSLNFIQEHETLLREIENATLQAMVETPESQYRHIQIATQPPERAFPQDLIITDNDLLHKVLTVLVFLCDEINELNEIAKTKLFAPLLMFGSQPAGAANEDEQEKLDGKKEKMIGSILPTLQEVSNFIDRCYSVSINMVQQLSSLISGKEQLYRSSFQNVHLEKVASLSFPSSASLASSLPPLPPPPHPRRCSRPWESSSRPSSPSTSSSSRMRCSSPPGRSTST